ncbi:MAG: hypothetical protein Q9159_001104 [Coniocarpon cinnabarinum]
MVSAKAWAERVASNVILDAAGLIAIAELKIIQRGTALTSSASCCDALVLCPGIHRQQDATLLNGGEYPMTANMNTNYIFRIENQATVAYMQTVGKTGHLTELQVGPDQRPLRYFPFLLDLSGPPLAQLCYLAALCMTVFGLALVIAIQDFWMMGVFAMLIIARLLNVVIIQRRRDAQWHGTKEPGQYASLLILASQDRWFRMTGFVDDLKAVTSGQWLRETTAFESAMEGVATMLVYLCAALASNGTQVGKITILVMFMVNGGLLAVSNGLTDILYMKEMTVRKTGAKRYNRRLEMAHELLATSKQKDWALKLGLVSSLKTDDEGAQSSKDSVVTA